MTRYSSVKDRMADWQHETLWERLVHCHGPKRAASIMDGTDPATNVDLAAWRNLGAGKRGVA